MRRFTATDPEGYDIAAGLANDQWVDFEIGADGSLTWNVENDFLGTSDAEGAWAGAGSYNYYYDPFTEPEEITPPAGKPRKPWAIIDKSFPDVYTYTSATPVTVCIDEEAKEVYMQGLYVDSNSHSRWIKGTISGTTVSFPSDQYLGYDDFDGIFMYFKGAVATMGEHPMFGLPMLVYTATESLDFYYDTEADRMIPKSANTAILVNCGRIGVYGDGMVEPVMQYQDPNTDQWKPCAPELGNWWPADDWYPYFEFELILPPYSTGYMLEAESDLYYRVYVNDELYTFTPEKYTSLSKNYTELPYNLSAGHDMSNNGSFHRLLLRELDGVSSVGFQQIYNHPGNGYQYLSDIVRLDTASGSVTTIPASSGLQNAMASEGTVVSTAYYDLSGRRVDATAKGCLLRHSVMADGSVRIEKILSR